MILQNELRIGNYIKDSLDRTFKINGFKDENAYLLLSNNDKIRYNIKTIKSIPLTADWLINFGFKKPNGINHFCFKTYVNNIEFTVFSTIDFEIFRIKNIPFYFIFNNIPHAIYSVHQLQNLYFALTNEELTLNKIL
jgi:hypothetical protein